MKKPLFWETVGLLAVVAILNYFATKYHLYWSVSEFDSLVHFLGGATLAMFFLWLYFFSGKFAPKRRDLNYFLLVSVAGSVFVAFCWEIYEILLGEAKFNLGEYPADTFLDIIMDILGMVAACFYGYTKELRENNLPSFAEEDKFATFKE